MRITLYSLFTISILASSAQSLRELYQEGVKAYEEKNYELFTAKMYAIDTMRPNFPAVVYNLAAGYALTGKEQKSIEILSKYILMDASRDFAEDKDFTSVTKLSAFAKISKKQRELTETIDLSQSIEFSLLDSHPESITYSDKLKSFLIGGVRDGNIWKTSNGKEPVLWAESTKNSWSVMGLEISPDGKTLWVCTSSMEYYENYHQDEEGFASVLKYEVKSGKLLETFALPGGHNFGDLVVDKDDNVYISDGTSNSLYWISKEKGKLEVLVDLSKTVYNLQGLTLNDDQSAIYISDYIDGIYKLNLESKEAKKLKIDASDVLLKGIDGLYFEGNALVGLHNGTNPNRVVRYQLSSDGNSIVGKEIIAQGGILGEPTQGVRLGDKFHFIMNSPWGAYDRDGNFSPGTGKLSIGILE